MTTKRVRMSKQQLNRAYQNRYRTALSGAEIDGIARQRDVALCRPVRKPVVKRKAYPLPSQPHVKYQG